MRKICLLGASGQLGNEILALNNASNQFLITPFTSKDVDITNEEALKNLFEVNEFDLVINCAAYTAVDLAEKEAAQSDLVNNTAVKYLANLCDLHEVFFIHISTDFVFDGKSKLAGEKWVENGIVIRTSWLYSSSGNNFVKTMMRLGRERNSLNVINNQFGTPTNAVDLAAAILTISSRDDLKEHSGIYHYSNEGQTSWYDFAVKVMELAEIDCQVNPIPDTEYPTPAKRPKYSVMDKNKIKSTFDLSIPNWEESLVECIVKIKDNEYRN